MSTTQFDEGLEEELFAFEDATDGNVVRAEVISVNKNTGGYNSEDKIVVQVRLPNGKKPKQSMPYPKGNSKDHEFVRLVESLGYTIGSAKHMIGDEVECKYSEEEGWNIIIPKSKMEQTKRGVSNIVSWVILPLILLKGHKESMENDSFVRDNIGFVLHTFLLMVVWFFAVFVSLILTRVAFDAVTLVL